MRLEATRLHAISHNGGFGDSLYDSAGEFPGLDLNFAANKNLTDSITGRNLIGFTRASSGTYVGADGLVKSATTNEARFDHNPTTGESIGLLVEEARTNLLLRSEELDNTGSWSRTNVSVDPDVAVAPDGTLTADKLIAANGIAVGSTRLTQTITKAAAATTYTLLIFAKTGDVGTGSVQLVVVDTALTSNNAGATFSTTLGTITVPAAPNGTFSNASATITPFANGWYRCSLTFTTSTEISIQARLTSRLPSPGDGTSGIYLWGAQLEAGAFATSYIPTTSATVTRAADVASITGTNFSSWYNQTEGTMFAEYKRLVNNTGRVCTFNDTTSSEQIRISASLSINIRPDWQVLDGGVVQANVLGAAEVAVGATGKTAGAYKLNDFQQATNRSLGTADTAGTLPTLTVLNIGANESGSNSMLNGTIKRLAYWATRLANATLQAITTP